MAPYLNFGVKLYIITKIFKGIKGKSQINAERDRLLALINNQGQDKIQEIKQAIEAVKSVLRDNQLKKDQEKVKEILGENWEDKFKGLSDKTKIEELKNLLIKQIKDFVAQNKGNTNAERERLLKLIEDEINRQEKAGKIDQGTAQKQKGAMLEGRKEQSKKDANKKMKEGHQKLIVKSDELPTSVFTPYKTLEEKLKSLKSLEEISDFNNRLGKEIKKVKEKKLKNIQDEAIKKIKEEIEGNSSKIELGNNKDYERKIREAKDPNVIELLEKDILALIREQKGESNEESLDNPTNLPDKTSLAKVLGIAALVVVPLIIVVLIILRMQRRKPNRERYS